MSLVSRLLPNERSRHVVIAAVIACLMAMVGFLAPIDRVVWLVESRINQKELSGEFVFVKANQDLTDPSRDERRIDLAQSLSKLKEMGAERIFVDMVFDEPSNPGVDAKLAEAISELGDSVILKQTLKIDSSELNNVDAAETTIAEIAGSAALATDSSSPDFLGYVWETKFSERVEGREVSSIPTVLADQGVPRNDTFYIDYNFDPNAVETIPFSSLSETEGSEELRKQVTGKTVIVGHSAQVAASSIKIPGYRAAPRSIVNILAAETLLRGAQPKIGVFALLACFVIGLLAVVQQGSSRAARHAGYWMIFLSTIAFMVYCNFTATVPHMAHSFGLLFVYGLMRFLANRKSKQLLFDSSIGLPTFVALERDLSKTGNVPSTAVIVAKLHRFEEVTSAMPNSSIAEYVQQIANRFRIAEQDLEIYTKGGKYLAWIAEVGDQEMLDSHLRGLRAVFAHPLLVHGVPVDVGITFAADMTAEDNAARKIASTTSTLEKTTEAHEPVKFAEMATEGDRWWSISLQAKIDEALEQGHIYVVFQPKLNVRENSVVGAEALVRWQDPERGNIAPNYFIEQCENAGRMDHLTRHVLRESLIAAKDFAKYNARFTVSVNISATMLRDYRVAEMVEEIVEKTGFNPRNLVLEITETSRIADYDIAYDVMTRLRLHGIKLSIDDFGVGSASMETLLRLPFDELKIDRAFIARMQDDQKARAISQMMIAFGKQTRITVVAEGVEDEHSLRLLRTLGCEVVQGYHISRPLGREKFAQFQTVNSKGLVDRASNG